MFERIIRNSKRIQARTLFPYNIVLIGFMGAGKSTVSDYLSTMFAMEIVEMDQVIADREEMSIPDIFSTYGEEYFRDLETDLLIEMQSRKNTIISCGGGAALRERNVCLLYTSAYKEEYVDMVKEGILDPAKVTRSALQNADVYKRQVLVSVVSE